MMRFITRYTFLFITAACVNCNIQPSPGDHVIHTTSTSPGAVVVNQDKSPFILTTPQAAVSSGHLKHHTNALHLTPSSSSLSHDASIIKTFTQPLISRDSSNVSPLIHDETISTVRDIKSPHRNDNIFPSSFTGQLTSLLTSASSPLSRFRSPFIMTLPDTFYTDYSASSSFHGPLTSPGNVDVVPLHKCKYCSSSSTQPVHATFNSPSLAVSHKYHSHGPSFLPPSPGRAVRPFLSNSKPITFPSSSSTPSFSKTNHFTGKSKLNSFHQTQSTYPVKGFNQANRKYPPISLDSSSSSHHVKGSPMSSKQLLNLKDSSRIVVLVVHLDKSDQSHHQTYRPNSIDSIKGSNTAKSIQHITDNHSRYMRQLHRITDITPIQQEQQPLYLYNDQQIKQSASPTVNNNVFFHPERIQLPYFTASLAPAEHISSASSSSSPADTQSTPSSSSSSIETFSSSNRNAHQSDDRDGNEVRASVTSASFIPSPREEDSTAFQPMTLLGHRMRSKPSTSADMSHLISSSSDDVQRKIENYASPISLSSSLSPTLTHSPTVNSKVPVSSMSLSFKSAISSLQPSTLSNVKSLVSSSSSPRRPPQRA